MEWQVDDPSLIASRRRSSLGWLVRTVRSGDLVGPDAAEVGGAAGGKPSDELVGSLPWLLIRRRGRPDPSIRDRSAATKRRPVRTRLFLPLPGGRTPGRSAD